MPNKEEPKKRKRMVVEEVKTDEAPLAEKEKAETVPEPKVLDEAAKDVASIEPEPEPINLPSEPKKSSSVALWIIIPGIFLLGAILGGIVFYQRGVSSGEETATSTPIASTSPLFTPAPSASPSATVNLSKYSISIYNGSGIAGEAGKAKTILTAAGFSVGSTANAASYDYTKTIIKAKSTVDASFVSALSTALGKTYVVVTPLTLASSSADVVQVVIGSSKAQ